jgi:prolipoprotein diacylglyceryltransferase
VIFPLYLSIGAFSVPAHLILDIVAFVAAAIYYICLRSKTADVVSFEDRLTLIIGALIGAMVGSRLLALSVDVPNTLANFSLLTIFTEQTIVGGIVGGIIGVEITKKIKSIKIPTGDIYVFPIILGIMIGRVGCFLTGVSDRTVGLPCSLPWCFDQGDGIPRHPTSLYEILFLGLLWVFLYQLQKKRRPMRAGVLFRLFIIAYALFRFCVDFIKPRETLLLGLSPIQALCLVAVMFFAIQLIYAYRDGLFLKRAT